MGKFILKKATNGEYMFNLKAGNGEIVATSELYTTMDAAENGVDSVKKNAVDAALEDQTVRDYKEEKNPKFEIFKDKADHFRFRLRASNGQIIAKSSSYTVKASAKNGIASVRKNAPNAPVLIQE